MIEWEEIVGLGSGGIALMMCYLFLNHMRGARVENTKALERISKTFADTVIRLQQQVVEELRRKQ